MSAVKRGLLLLGSFAIATNLSTFLHELCHSMMAYFTGGTVSYIVIHPFTWSYSYSTSPHPLLHTLAGPVGTIVVGMLLFILLSRWPKTYLLPLLLIGPLALISNGGYLFIDILMKSGGDGCSLAQKGVPPSVIITVGIIFLISGLILAIRFFRRIGLLAVAFKDRLVTLGLGIIPYLMAIPIWNFLYNRHEIVLFLAHAVFGSILTVIFAAIPVRSQDTEPKQLRVVSLKTVISIDLLAITFIVFLLYGPLSGKKIYSERPEDFPSVLTAPSYGTDTRHREDPGVYYMLSYDIPESISPDEIRNYLMELHKENGYMLLKHNLFNPNEINDNAWKEHTLKKDEDHFKWKNCYQRWLKIDTEIATVRFIITYNWKNEKFDEAFVVQTISARDMFESIINYADLHPEEFSQIQLERLKSLVGTNSK